MRRGGGAGWCGPVCWHATASAVGPWLSMAGTACPPLPRPLPAPFNGTHGKIHVPGASLAVAGAAGGGRAASARATLCRPAKGRRATLRSLQPLLASLSNRPFILACRANTRSVAAPPPFYPSRHSNHDDDGAARKLHRAGRKRRRGWEIWRGDARKTSISKVWQHTTFRSKAGRGR